MDISSCKTLSKDFMIITIVFILIFSLNHDVSSQNVEFKLDDSNYFNNLFYNYNFYNSNIDIKSKKICYPYFRYYESICYFNYHFPLIKSYLNFFPNKSNFCYNVPKFETFCYYAPCYQSLSIFDFPLILNLSPYFQNFSPFGLIPCIQFPPGQEKHGPILISIVTNTESITFTSIGKTHQLTVTGTYSDGRIADLTSHATGTTYISSNPELVGVSDDGLITAKAEGKTLITIKNSGISINVMIEVMQINPEISIKSAFDSILLKVDESESLTFTIHFEYNGTDLYHIVAEQEVCPDNNGISFSNDYPADGWYPDGTKTYLMNEEIYGHSPGHYKLTKRIRIEEIGIISEFTVNVAVYESISEPKILSLGVEPGAISVSTPTPVIFTTTILKPVSIPVPSEVILEHVDNSGNLRSILGHLLDTGLDDDLEAGDSVYTGTFTINEPHEGSAYFRAKAVFEGISAKYSPVYSLLVNHLPNSPAKSDMSKVVTQSSTGAKILSNEILVTLAKGVETNRIESIAGSIGGEVVGSIPVLGVYQVKISDTGDDRGVEDAISQLAENADVITAEPNYILNACEVTPNDPFFSLKYNNPFGEIYTQWGLRNIRANEAWVISRGDENNLCVAVLDTGVDYNHPDLIGKVNTCADYDFINCDDDAMDDEEEVGHGTMVAGIIMANTNNGIGVAGVSWGGRILPIKVIAQNGLGPASTIAAGIIYAANIGARILNMSLGSYYLSQTVYDACWYAYDSRGCLLIAGAGNDGENTMFYPCSLPIAVTCVTGINQLGERWDMSNYGYWVDISAPAQMIYSTTTMYSPPYNGYVGRSGTSLATAFVSGAAAVIWAQDPCLSASEVRANITRTAQNVLDDGMGYGRLDLFDALFNGGFESHGLFKWSGMGTANTIPFLGSILPSSGDRMGYASTGPDYFGVDTSATLSQTFAIQPGIEILPIALDYNLLTEDFVRPFYGCYPNDFLNISLTSLSGTQTILRKDIWTCHSSDFSPLLGFNFPGSSHLVWTTDWQTIVIDIPVIGGTAEFTINVTDGIGPYFDTAVLIDNIRFIKPIKVIALRASNGQYVCAEGGGGGEIMANRDIIDIWETFEIIDLGNNEIALRVYNGQYISAEGGGGGRVLANSDDIGSWETFGLIDLGNNEIALRAYNGQYVSAEGGGGGRVLANSNDIGSWETFTLRDLKLEPLI